MNAKTYDRVIEIGKELKNINEVVEFIKRTDELFDENANSVLLTNTVQKNIINFLNAELSRLTKEIDSL